MKYEEKKDGRKTIISIMDDNGKEQICIMRDWRGLWVETDLHSGVFSTRTDDIWGQSMAEVIDNIQLQEHWDFEEIEEDPFADEKYAEEQYDRKLRAMESWGRDSRYN